MVGAKQLQGIHHSAPFAGIRFLLVGFNPALHEQVKSKLVSLGAVDAGEYGPNCTHVIVQNIVYDDPICVTARKDGKTLVTSLWLDHSLDIGEPVDADSVMYGPLKDLNGIPGAKELVVCLTGYQRQDREDIMIMVGLMGAQFSKPLVANKVTHLLCYKFEGEKYDLAKRMKKIKLVNHLWVEDCLKAWKILPEELYSKSTYELEMMQADVKDSDEETGDIAENLIEGRNVDAIPSLQNGMAGSSKASSPPKQQGLPHAVSANNVMFPFKEEKKSDQASMSERLNTIDDPSTLHHREGNSNAEEFSSLSSSKKTPTRKSCLPLHIGDNLGNISEASSKKLTGSDTGKCSPSITRKSPRSLSLKSAGKWGNSDGQVEKNLSKKVVNDVCISNEKADKEKGASASVGVQNSEQAYDSNSGKGSPVSLSKAFSLQTPEKLCDTDSELGEILADQSVGACTSNVEQEKGDAAAACIAASRIGNGLLNEEGSGGPLPQKRKVDGQSNDSLVTPKSRKLASSASKRIDATDPKTPVSSPHVQIKDISLNPGSYIGDNTTKPSSGHKSSPNASSVKSNAKSGASRNLALEKLQGHKSIHLATITSPNAGSVARATALCVDDKKEEAQNQQLKALSSSCTNDLEVNKSASPKDADYQIVSSISKPSRKKTMARKTLGARAKLSKKPAATQKGSLSGNSFQCDAANHSIGQMKNHAKSPSSPRFNKSCNAINEDAGLLDDETEPPPELDVQNDNSVMVELSHVAETRPTEGSSALLGQTDEADITTSTSDKIHKQGGTVTETGHAKRKWMTQKKGLSGRTKISTVRAGKETPNNENDVERGKSGEEAAIEREQVECATGEKSCDTLLLNKSNGPMEVAKKTEVVSNIHGAGKGAKQTKKIAGKKRRGTLILPKPEGAIEVARENEPDPDEGKDKHIGKLATKPNLTKGPVASERENDPIVSNDQGASKGGKLARKLGGKKRRGTLVLNKSEESFKEGKENEKVVNDAQGGSHGEKCSKKLVGNSNPKARKSDEMAINTNSSDNQVNLCALKHEPARFLLSGHRLQRKEFQQIIKRLNGKLCRDSHQWSYQATHLIVPEPLRRTEKFFAAAASGRWILKSDYLTAISQVGMLLPEEPYEWHKNGLSEDGAIHLEAPRKWRLLRQKTGHGAFYGMRIVIYGELIAPPLDTLKRVVKAGDGTILATSPPYSRFIKSGVDFAIVSPGMPRADIWVQEFLNHEIPCVSADYLVEYVCKPGHPLERHVLYNTHEWAAKSYSNLLSLSEEVVADATTLGDQEEVTDDLACQVCGSTDRAEVMLICGDESGSAGCGVGMHIDCCDPPLEAVPEEDWFCPRCSESRNKPSESSKKQALSKRRR